MSLTLYERETVILFNEEEQTASVFTYNSRLKRRLQDICKNFPSDVTPDKPCHLTDKDAVTYTLPKKWVKINPPPVYSAEQKARRAAILKANVTAPTSTVVDVSQG